MTETWYISGPLAIGTTTAQAQLHVEGGLRVTHGGTISETLYVDQLNAKQVSFGTPSVDLETTLRALHDRLQDQLSSLQRAVSMLVPAGTVVAYAGTREPEGWMFCRGQRLAKSDARYAALFQAIGTSHGGDATSFCVPDYRGVFLRGVSEDSNEDPGKANRTSRYGGNAGNAVGSYQADAVVSHGHSVHGDQLEGKAGTGFFGAGLASNSAGGAYTSEYPASTFGDTETRPRNVAVYYLIKL